MMGSKAVRKARRIVNKYLGVEAAGDDGFIRLMTDGTCVNATFERVVPIEVLQRKKELNTTAKSSLKRGRTVTSSSSSSSSSSRSSSSRAAMPSLEVSDHPEVTFGGRHGRAVSVPSTKYNVGSVGDFTASHDRCAFIAHRPGFYSMTTLWTAEGRIDIPAEWDFRFADPGSLAMLAFADRRVIRASDARSWVPRVCCVLLRAVVLCCAVLCDLLSRCGGSVLAACWRAASLGALSRVPCSHCRDCALWFAGAGDTKGPVEVVDATVGR
jgi:hypothetical protein